MKISTRIFFEAAHRLVDYKGKCERPHGHSFIVDIEIESDVLDKAGMIVDFNKLKLYIDEFDHKLLLKECEENLKYFGHLPNDWVYWMDINPTCENLSQFIKDGMTLVLGKGKDWNKYKIKVRVYETYKPIKTSYAEV